VRAGKQSAPEGSSGAVCLSAVGGFGRQLAAQMGRRSIHLSIH
jgi:hypothetical protein